MQADKILVIIMITIIMIIIIIIIIIGRFRGLPEKPVHGHSNCRNHLAALVRKCC